MVLLSIKNKAQVHYRKDLFFSLSVHVLVCVALYFAAGLESSKRAETPKPAKASLANQPSQIILEVADINEDTPEETEFLSKKNQKVLKQTQSNGLQSLAPVKTSTAPAPAAKPSKTKGANSKSLSLDQLAQVKPLETQQKSSSSAHNPNYIKDVETGVQTALSTKAFAYHGYYSRIQRQLEHRWKSDVQERLKNMFFRGRTLASTSSHTTKLIVGLDKFGSVKKLFLVSKSGLKDLDDSALTSFKEAGPFPNPPQELVEEDGFIYIHWNFVVES